MPRVPPAGHGRAAEKRGARKAALKRVEDFRVVSLETRVRAACECVLAPLGVLFEKDTIADCMADEAIRPFFGRTLKEELMPLFPADGRDEAVIAACGLLSERPVSPACDSLLDGLIGRYCLHIMPALKADAPGLVFSAAALVMLFSGVRRGENGYEIVGARGGFVPLEADADALLSFSHLSCDMDAESLAYAVLADRTIWGCDLRAIEGLTEALADALRDIQLTGLATAMTNREGRGKTL